MAVTLQMLSRLFNLSIFLMLVSFSKSVGRIRLSVCLLWLILEICHNNRRIQGLCRSAPTMAAVSVLFRHKSVGTLTLIQYRMAAFTMRLSACGTN